MNTYELPMIRCFGCNKPIAHLHAEYQELLKIMNVDNVNLNKEIFDILNVKNPCCREKLSLPEVIIINKPDDAFIADIKPSSNNTSTTNTTSKLTQIKTAKTEIQVKNVKNEEKSCIPVSFNVSHKRKKISDNLYISYATDVVYLTQ